MQSLVDEYKACESADYIKWGMEVGIPFKSSFSSVYANLVVLCNMSSVQDSTKRLSGEGTLDTSIVA